MNNPTQPAAAAAIHQEYCAWCEERLDAISRHNGNCRTCGHHQRRFPTAAIIKLQETQTRTRISDSIIAEAAANPNLRVNLHLAHKVVFHMEEILSNMS